MLQRFKVLVVVLLAAIGMLAGCAQQTTYHGTPRALVFDSDHGRWRLEMDPEVVPDRDSVPVVTIHRGQRVEGLLLVPGTRGFEHFFPKTLRASIPPYVTVPVVWNDPGAPASWWLSETTLRTDWYQVNTWPSRVVSGRLLLLWNNQHAPVPPGRDVRDSTTTPLFDGRALDWLNEL